MCCLSIRNKTENQLHKGEQVEGFTMTREELLEVINQEVQDTRTTLDLGGNQLA